MTNLDPIPALLEQVDERTLRDCLFYLSSDPLPFRKANLTLPGHAKCTLHEADDFVAARLEACGYGVEREAVRVQAIRSDTSKPMPHQFARPEPSDPWYTAYNLYASKTGKNVPGDLVIVISHKDSQSWTDSPGALDNAVGTVANLEIARVLSGYESQRTIRFVFCNEEHSPWTSVIAAQKTAQSGLRVVAVLNLDSIAGKSQADSDAGRKTNVTRYTTPEGEQLAELMAVLNQRYNVGLLQQKYHCEKPHDDDGSFIKAGVPAAVLNIGSFPYADPNYHSSGDTPEKVDIENLWMATRLSLAFVVHLDMYGFPASA